MLVQCQCKEAHQGDLIFFCMMAIACFFLGTLQEETNQLSPVDLLAYDP
ncbi:hypothetical protein [Laspinema olomoucense]|uniref:Uncharacterized protein n=1 Tax=Laspinema olomoucense D3b TaxID=2953688 RepID=A0ABT2NB94_9CYAN|nr:MULTISPECIES: hypothetical protein [unclassified Laspinema]MCT7975066.1 hypothetical protein [Laspinema sp. D3d]MCT7978620.1 hypothetical protein [Laspinema sp. D3b]MCT7987146.1 hypothetical protein [Laspinema sp. D3a]MCT7992281.1 hypothetical protein [Laspinema sp. D3c]